MNPTPREIRELRNAAGLTMRQAADLLEIHRSTYEHYEYGRRRMAGPTWRLFQLLTEKYR